MKALALVVLVACGGGDFGADNPGVDSNPTPDAPIGCVTGITYTPTSPVAAADTVVRAVAHVTGSDVQPEYTWLLSIDNVFCDGVACQPPTLAQPDGSEVEFPATQDAIYRLRFRLADLSCPEALEDIDVNAPGVGEIAMRVHVAAPPSAHRAPFDETRIIQGGAQEVTDPIQLDGTTTVAGSVLAGGSGVEAYLKLAPGGDTDAATEAFSDAGGAFTADLKTGNYEVLVVPKVQTVPPQVVSWNGQGVISLATGVTVSGSVKTSANAGIANAKVQLVIDGLPSTIGTTSGTGAFTLHAMPAAVGASVRVEVTPPATTGLPRLVATSTAIDIGASVDIKYAAITTRDLGGTTIQRGGPLAGASVSIVGTLASAGTINTTITATGEIRQSATTDGAGKLPSLLAPATSLDAVIFPGATGDHAVTPIDLTATVPNSITAAATVTKSTRISNPLNTAGLPGAVIDAVPKGTLALAGAPTIRKIANASGQVSFGLAPNASYDLRLADPNGNRGALRIIPATSATAIPANTPLLTPTTVTGIVLGGSAIPGAVVQLLCTSCTGLDRDRPVAEGVTGADGRFSLAVPDPN